MKVYLVMEDWCNDAEWAEDRMRDTNVCAICTTYNVAEKYILGKMFAAYPKEEDEDEILYPGGIPVGRFDIQYYYGKIQLTLYKTDEYSFYHHSTYRYYIDEREVLE